MAKLVDDLAILAGSESSKSENPTPLLSSTKGGSLGGPQQLRTASNPTDSSTASSPIVQGAVTAPDAPQPAAAAQSTDQHTETDDSLKTAIMHSDTDESPPSSPTGDCQGSSPPSPSQVNPYGWGSAGWDNETGSSTWRDWSPAPITPPFPYPAFDDTIFAKDIWWVVFRGTYPGVYRGRDAVIEANGTNHGRPLPAWTEAEATKLMAHAVAADKIYRHPWGA